MDPIMRNVRASMAAALNKTADQTKNQAVSIIGEAYQVNTGGKRVSVKNNIYVAFRASQSSLRAVIKATGRPIGAVKFPHFVTGMGRGVVVVIKSEGQGGLIRTAFVAKMQSGHIGIFRRDGPKVMPSKGRYEATSTKRQKIFEVWTVSTASMFASRGVEKKLLDFASKIFPKILKNQVDWRNK
jgi:hypothetical protein